MTGKSVVMVDIDIAEAAMRIIEALGAGPGDRNGRSAQELLASMPPHLSGSIIRAAEAVVEYVAERLDAGKLVQ